MILLQDFKNTPKELWIFKIFDRLKSLLFNWYYLKKDIADSSFILTSYTFKLLPNILCGGSSVNHRDHKSTNHVKWYSLHELDVFGNYCNFSTHHSIDTNKFDLEGNWLKTLVNKSNLSRAKDIWAEIIKLNSSYLPIDWQLDATSGYKFSSKVWYKSNLIGMPKDADIKGPWELGRLQHILRMSLASMNEKSREESLIETKCQLLDFIMSNPPRWGVNWRSTMDVGIRAANMTMALNILISQQSEFVNSPCCDIIKSSLLDHYYHILANHERKNGLGNNHYLSNIVGLLYAAYSIDEKFIVPTVNKYIHELFLEINKQFLPDGGNFESSTTYHALSTEICVYGMAIVDRMQKDNEYRTIRINTDDQLRAKERLYKAFNYLQTVIYDDGTLLQLGDNDSGRLFKWTFNGNKIIKDEIKNLYHNPHQETPGVIDFDENYLNYSSVLNLCRGYFGKHDDNSFEGNLIRTISGNTSYESKEIDRKEILLSPNPKIELKNKNETFIKFEEGLHDELKLHVFQDSGVYIFQSEEIKIIINGTNCNVRQYWPHGHNDKLSFSINCKGKEYFRDPGSYSYTGNPVLRNLYRSVNAHNSPNHGKEQNLWIDGKEGVFRLIPRTKVNIVAYSVNSIKLSLNFDDVIHQREWIVTSDEIIIKDESNKEFDSNFYPEIRFSNGYGKMLKEFA